MHVHCCLSLCLLWEPSTSAVSTLWEYYCRNLVRFKPRVTDGVIHVIKDARTRCVASCSAYLRVDQNTHLLDTCSLLSH